MPFKRRVEESNFRSQASSMSLFHTGSHLRTLKFPTIQRECLARVRATLTLRQSFKNPISWLGALSLHGRIQAQVPPLHVWISIGKKGCKIIRVYLLIHLDRTQDRIMMSSSLPWNPSTVDIFKVILLDRIHFFIRFVFNFSRIFATCSGEKESMQ